MRLCHPIVSRLICICAVLLNHIPTIAGDINALQRMQAMDALQRASDREAVHQELVNEAVKQDAEEEAVKASIVRNIVEDEEQRMVKNLIAREVIADPLQKSVLERMIANEIMHDSVIRPEGRPPVKSPMGHHSYKHPYGYYPSHTFPYLNYPFKYPYGYHPYGFHGFLESKYPQGLHPMGFPYGPSPYKSPYPDNPYGYPFSHPPHKTEQSPSSKLYPHYNPPHPQSYGLQTSGNPCVYPYGQNPNCGAYPYPYGSSQSQYNYYPQGHPYGGPKPLGYGSNPAGLSDSANLYGYPFSYNPSGSYNPYGTHPQNFPQNPCSPWGSLNYYPYCRHNSLFGPHGPNDAGKGKGKGGASASGKNRKARNSGIQKSSEHLHGPTRKLRGNRNTRSSDDGLFDSLTGKKPNEETSAGQSVNKQQTGGKNAGQNPGSQDMQGGNQQGGGGQGNQGGGGNMGGTSGGGKAMKDEIEKQNLKEKSELLDKVSKDAYSGEPSSIEKLHKLVKSEKDTEAQISKIRRREYLNRTMTMALDEAIKNGADLSKILDQELVIRKYHKSHPGIDRSIILKQIESNPAYLTKMVKEIAPVLVADEIARIEAIPGSLTTMDPRFAEGGGGAPANAQKGTVTKGSLPLAPILLGAPEKPIEMEIRKLINQLKSKNLERAFDSENPNEGDQSLALHVLTEISNKLNDYPVKVNERLKVPDVLYPPTVIPLHDQVELTTVNLTANVTKNPNLNASFDEENTTIFIINTTAKLEPTTTEEETTWETTEQGIPEPQFDHVKVDEISRGEGKMRLGERLQREGIPVWVLGVVVVGFLMLLLIIGFVFLKFGISRDDETHRIRSERHYHLTRAIRDAEMAQRKGGRLAGGGDIIGTIIDDVIDHQSSITSISEPADQIRREIHVPSFIEGQRSLKMAMHRKQQQNFPKPKERIHHHICRETTSEDDNSSFASETEMTTPSEQYSSASDEETTSDESGSEM